MWHCLRVEVHDDDAGDDEGHAKGGGRVGDLVVEKDAGDRDEDDAEAGPDSIGRADWNRVEGVREKVERDDVAGDDDERRPKTRELLGLFEGARGDDFGDDGDGEAEIAFHGAVWLKGSCNAVFLRAWFELEAVALSLRQAAG